jgi:hypothetical protein
VLAIVFKIYIFWASAFISLAAVHTQTGAVQNKSIACQADFFLLVSKQENVSCPVFLHQSNNRQTSVHGMFCYDAFFQPHTHANKKYLPIFRKCGIFTEKKEQLLKHKLVDHFFEEACQGKQNKTRPKFFKRVWGHFGLMVRGLS